MRQYHELLRHILENGTHHEDRTGVGTISAFGYQTRFDLREDFPIVTTKRVPFRWVAEELFWFLSGSTSEKDLNARGVDIWAEWATAEQTARFAREEGDLGPVYGYLWRSFGGDYPQTNGVDQPEVMRPAGRSRSTCHAILPVLASTAAANDLRSLSCST